MILTGHYSGTPPQQEALRVDNRVRDLEGEIDAELDGIAYKLGAGDVLFAGVGSTHAFYIPRRAVTDQS